jgi:hypothetical protein
MAPILVRAVQLKQVVKSHLLHELGLLVLVLELASKDFWVKLCIYQVDRTPVKQIAAHISELEHLLDHGLVHNHLEALGGPLRLKQVLQHI